MSAVSADVAELYPKGSTHWMFVQDERAFRDLGCGWRRVQIAHLGHKWVKLSSGYTPFNIRVDRAAFIAMRPQSNSPVGGNSTQ